MTIAGLTMAEWVRRHGAIFDRLGSASVALALEAGWAGESAQAREDIDLAAFNTLARELLSEVAAAERVPPMPIPDAAQHFALSLAHRRRVAEMAARWRGAVEPLPAIAEAWSTATRHALAAARAITIALS